MSNCLIQLNALGGLLQGSLLIKITAIYLAFTIERLKIMEIFLKHDNLLIVANNSALKALFTYLYTNPPKKNLSAILPSIITIKYAVPK
ncbi:hypothetical protein LB467_15165 [Salegentibacter sp. JZCK2]|uniref:hypothetical protein n=1 Tax=Salegentibacter tibetensis TaxID=2873600 RepID=UPI001CCAC833|nr:hypothetical protein [Salegentibacter tibetensis]MBZ9731033.1 hypothetical protein [Salegentibacter tibetensis]